MKKKKTYEKPTMTVMLLQHRTMLLSASQPDNTPWWDGEGD